MTEGRLEKLRHSPKAEMWGYEEARRLRQARLDQELWTEAQDSPLPGWLRERVRKPKRKPRLEAGPPKPIMMQEPVKGFER
ncbi:MAG: hypothetical protein QUS09_08510 [Methanotrichaceae archaeon]|nr:hypothetical protein [Methanotrichaceae archaeon]